MIAGCLKAGGGFMEKIPTYYLPDGYPSAPQAETPEIIVRQVRVA